MKIYLNIHETTEDRFLGIDKLTESDRLTIICETGSDFCFSIEEVKILLQAKCCVSVVDTDNIEDTLDTLVKRSKEKEEEVLILNDIKNFYNLKQVL